MGRTEKRIEAFAAEIREAGLRMTAQRRLILTILAGSDDHPDAKSIYQRGFAQDPTLAMSTVYRTMKLLEERGAIDRHAFADGASRYEHADDRHHDHLIDIDTGQVVEFVSDEIEKLQARIAAELGYEIVRHRLELYGRKKVEPSRKGKGKRGG
jgi:Fur family transcriptional regulator, ferric uptake regulator